MNTEASTKGASLIIASMVLGPIAVALTVALCVGGCSESELTFRPATGASVKGEGQRHLRKRLLNPEMDPAGWELLIP